MDVHEADLPSDGLSDVAQATGFIGRVSSGDFDHVDGANAPHIRSAFHPFHDHAINVVSIREPYTEWFGFASEMHSDGIRVDQTVLGRPRGTDEFVEVAIEDGKAFGHGVGIQEFDDEARLFLELAFRPRQGETIRIVVEPEVSRFAKSKEGRMGSEEIEGHSTGFDVDGLPPCCPGPSGVQLGRGVDATQVEIDHADVAHAALRQSPGESRTDDTSARDENMDAFHEGLSSDFRSAATDVDVEGLVDEIRASIAVAFEALEQHVHLATQ